VQILWRFCAYLDEGKIATVVEIVTVKASKNLKLQQISTTGTQQVPYQSVTNLNFQQISITYGIWFGTRGSEVQILSPRPDVNARFPANCSGLSLRVAPPDYHRLLVNGVIAGSPAAQAGIRAGDAIKAVGHPNTIPRPNEVLQLAEIRTELEEPGQSFIVQIDRDGKPMRFEFVTRDMY
jgi:S1-C subfamily serine protease